MNKANWHTFQVLTKRPDRLIDLSPKITWTPNIWMGVTVENSRALERVEKLNLTYNQKNFITSSQQYNSQVQIAKDKWLVIPASTKDKVKMLNVMNVVLHLGIKIEYI